MALCVYLFLTECISRATVLYGCGLLTDPVGKGLGTTASGFTGHADLHPLLSKSCTFAFHFLVVNFKIPNFLFDQSTQCPLTRCQMAVLSKQKIIHTLNVIFQNYYGIFGLAVVHVSKSTSRVFL